MGRAKKPEGFGTTPEKFGFSGSSYADEPVLDEVDRSCDPPHGWALWGTGVACGLLLGSLLGVVLSPLL